MELISVGRPVAYPRTYKVVFDKKVTSFLEEERHNTSRFTSKPKLAQRRTYHRVTDDVSEVKTAGNCNLSKYY